MLGFKIMAYLFLWAVIAITTYSSIRIFIKHEFSEWPHLEKRQIKVKALNVVVFYIAIVLLLISMIVSGDLSPVNLGIKHIISPYACFAAGFVVNLLWQIAYRTYFHKFAILDSTIVNYRTFRTLLPKQRVAKYIVMITIVLFNPIFEEIVFRGFLVHNLGIQIGNIYIPIVIGYMVFIALHLYQGVPVIFQHTLHYAFFIGFLFSPLGLIGAIGFHFGGDLFPLLWMNDVIKNYKLKYRESRESGRLGKVGVRP